MRINIAADKLFLFILKMLLCVFFILDPGNNKKVTRILCSF
jgi:hypothetical protein